MNTLQVIVPVYTMLLLGILCNKINLISQTGVDNIKKYITSVPLPLTIFHAVSTASYNRDIILVFAIMLTTVIIALFLGFLIKGIVPEPYKKYFPYIMTIYEGGMMAFPLYQNLMGSENMSNIAIIDMPCAIFAFGIYFGLVKLTDQGTKINGKELLKNAFSTPSFIALLSGLFLGATGLMTQFMNLDISSIYLSTKELITAPLSAMILLCVGYEFMLEKEYLAVCSKTAVARLAIQGCLFGLVYLVTTRFQLSQPMIIGFALYFFTMPSLCLSSFVKNKEASKYIATTSSLYLIITLAFYIILSSIIL